MHLLSMNKLKQTNFHYHIKIVQRLLQYKENRKKKSNDHKDLVGKGVEHHFSAQEIQDLISSMANLDGLQIQKPQVPMGSH